MKTLDWAVGLYEGEGSCYFDKSNKQWRVKLKMTDKDVIEEFHSVVGVGKVYFEPNKNHKPAWNWVLFRQAEVKELLTKFLPLLGERRAARASEAIEYLTTKDDCNSCKAEDSE